MAALTGIATGVIAASVYDIGKTAYESGKEAYEDIRQREQYDAALSPVATEFQKSLEDQVQTTVERHEVDAPIVKHDWEKIIERIGGLDPVFEDRWTATLEITRAIAEVENIELEKRTVLKHDLTDAVAKAMDNAIAHFREKISDDDELYREFSFDAHVTTIEYIEELRSVIGGREYFNAYPSTEIGVESAIEFITRDIDTPEFVGREEEIADEPSSEKILVTGRRGTGKTRVLAQLVRQADLSAVDRIIVPRESYLTTEDFQQLESASFDGDVLLVWDDVHKITADRENKMLELTVNKLDDLLAQRGQTLHVFAAAQSQYVDDLPGDAFSREGFWSGFNRLSLNSMSPDALRDLVEKAITEFNADVEKEAKAVLIDKAIETDPAPSYVLSAFHMLNEGETLTETKARQLPPDVEKVWKKRFSTLKEKNQQAANVLLAARLLHDLNLQKPVVTISGIYRHLFAADSTQGKLEFTDCVRDLIRWDWVDLAGESVTDENAYLVGHDLPFEIHEQGLNDWYKEFSEFINEHLSDRHLPLEDNFAYSVHKQFGLFLRDIDQDRAEQQFRLAKNKNPDSPLPYIYLGVSLSDQEKYKEAEEQYRNAIRIDPKNPHAHYNLGVCLENQEEDRDEEAKKHYRKAIETDPQYTEAQCSLAMLLHKQGKDKAAKEHFLNAIDTGSMNAEAYYSFGVFLQSQGHNKEAEKQFRIAIEIDSEFAEAHHNLGYLLDERGKDEKAENHYRKAIEIDSEAVKAHYNLGQLLEEQGRVEEAEKHYRNAVKADPQCAEAQYNLGMLLYRQGRNEGAEEHLRNAIEIDSKHAKVHVNLGVLLYRQGKNEEAEEHYRTAIEIDSETAKAHHNLAVLLRAQGEDEEAEEHYRTAIEIDPEYTEAHYNLAVLLDEQGEDEEAEEHYRTAIEISPQFAEAQFRLGTFLDKQGEHKEAKKHVERSVMLRLEQDDLEGATACLTHLINICDELDERQTAVQRCFDTLSAVEVAGIASEKASPMILQIIQRLTADPKEFIYVGYEHGIDRDLLGETPMSLRAATLWLHTKLWVEETNKTLGDRAIYWLESGVILLAMKHLSPGEGLLGLPLETIETTVESRQDELAPPSRAVFDYLSGTNSNVTADDLIEKIDRLETVDQHNPDIIDNLSLEEKRTLFFANLLETLQKSNTDSS